MNKIILLTLILGALIGAWCKLVLDPIAYHISQPEAGCGGDMACCQLFGDCNSDFTK